MMIQIPQMQKPANLQTHDERSSDLRISRKIRTLRKYERKMLWCSRTILGFLLLSTQRKNTAPTKTRKDKSLIQVHQLLELCGLHTKFLLCIKLIAGRANGSMMKLTHPSLMIIEGLEFGMRCRSSKTWHHSLIKQ